MAQDFDDLFETPEIPRTIAAAYLGGLKVAVSDLLVHRVASSAAKNLGHEGLGQHLRKATKAITANTGTPVARKQGRIRDAMNLEMHQRRNSGVYDKAAADEAVVDPAAQAPAAEPAPSPEEQAMAEMAPGAVESPAEDPMGASPEELSLHLAELVSHEFKMHQWYTYYAEMIRGVERGGLVELFEELAPLELEDGKYFARRLSVLGPGTVIPVTPNPEPLQDPMQIAGKMLQEEQRAVMLLQNFHTLCGEDPMRFQIEQMMADEQVHADRLQQFMASQTAAPKKPKGEKLAAAVQQVKQELVVQPAEQEQAQQIAVDELQAQNAQLTAERADLSQRLQGVSQMAQQHMQQAQDAAVMQQQLGEESAQAQEQAMMSQQQAQAATQEAADHAQVAAMEADAKMRLGIRIQQMRQRLSEMVTEDPVAEEGADMPAIPTSTQQGMMDSGVQDPGAQDPAAGADPAAQDPAAAEGGAAAEPPAETTTEPAAPAAKPKDKDPKSKPKSDADDAKVEVKVGSVLQRAGELVTGSKARQLTRQAGEHLNEAKVWMGRAASQRDSASEVGLHGGQKALRRIAAGNADAREGQAIKRHWDASGAAKAEQGKVNRTRAAVGGLAGGAAIGAAGGSEPKTASKGKALKDAVFSSESGTLPAAAFGPLSHLFGAGDKHNVGRRAAGTIVGAAAGHEGSKRLNKDGESSRLGTMLGGGAGNAVVHHFTKRAGALNRIVSRLHGAGKKLEDKAKEKGREALREIADNPETKKRLEQVARDAGHHAMDQASKHPAIGQAKKGLERGAKQLAGVTAGAAALSAGTSIYQNNKTRRFIREHDHV